MKPLVSVVMPYWVRAQATRVALERYAELYDPRQVEIVLVDDGSPREPAQALEGIYGNLTVLTLPRKESPLNPCVPINRGVAAANGELIGLSNPEVVHEGPALLELLGLVEQPLDYAVATAWCPEAGQWHAHPTLAHHPDMRLACGHFLAVLTRDLWEAAGGFDESYRHGCGYDDTDFIARIIEVGARIRWGETRVVHHKRGAQTDWAALPSNEEWYRSKWSSRPKSYTADKSDAVLLEAAE